MVTGKSKDIKRNYITYSPKLIELPDPDVFYLNRYYRRERVPVMDEYTDNLGDNFSKHAALKEIKRVTRYKAERKRVIDLSDNFVDKDRVKDYRFYSVRIPRHIVERDGLKTRKIVEPIQDSFNLSDQDYIDLMYEMRTRNLRNMARHKRVTKGKKSHRS